MTDADWRTRMTKRVIDRTIDEMLGFCRGILGDGILTDDEIIGLHRWIVGSGAANESAMVAQVLARIEAVLAKPAIDAESRQGVMDMLMRFTGNDFELGEVLKPTDLPITQPLPVIDFPGKRFCFTGTFTFGKRVDCESAVVERGGTSGTLTRQTDFLVIGAYATPAWRHSSYGTKIEKAAAMAGAGHPIAIVNESHWRASLPRLYLV